MDVTRHGSEPTPAEQQVISQIKAARPGWTVRRAAGWEILDEHGQRLACEMDVYYAWQKAEGNR